jgi:hypothetical protein
MQWQRPSHVRYNRSLSHLLGSIAAADRNLCKAKVISLDAARAVFRRQEPEHRMTQAGITEDRREHAFVLRDEPSLQFRDFYADL